jgi:hypothetical protein
VHDAARSHDRALRCERKLVIERGYRGHGCLQPEPIGHYHKWVEKPSFIEISILICRRIILTL